MIWILYGMHPVPAEVTGPAPAGSGGLQQGRELHPPAQSAAAQRKVGWNFPMVGTSVAGNNSGHCNVNISIFVCPNIKEKSSLPNTAL